jgi:hypothetical protein
MSRNIIRRLPAALLVGGVLLFTATAAIGAGNSITLDLHGGVNQQLTACSQVNHYMAYNLGSKISMEGYVTPAPALPDQTWKVKIKIKKCVNGSFVTVAQFHVLGNGVIVNSVKEGHFRGIYAPTSTGFYFARAYYYGFTPAIQSLDQHFHVLPPPKIALSPTTGRPGTAVKTTGVRFASRERVTVAYRTGKSAPAPTTVTICTATTTATGAFACTGKIPGRATAGATGAHVIMAKGASGDTAHATFKLG